MSYLNRLTYVQRLYEIAPGFRNDRDDDWICHLNFEEQRIIHNARALFIEDIENLKEHVSNNAYELSKCADTAARKAKEAQMKPARDKLELRIQNTARELVKQISEYKRKAKEIAVRVGLKDHERVARRIQDDAVSIHSDSNSEEEDEYLPSKKRRLDPTPAPNPKPTSTPAVTQPEAPPRRPPTESPTKKAEEAMTDGLDPKDAEIVIHLKQGIMKFRCLDRVNKALLAYRDGEKIVTALEHLDKCLDIIRKTKK